MDKFKFDCNQYDATTIQQLYKIVSDKEHGGYIDKNVFPVSVIQSIFNGLTGDRLDTILSMFNCIYLPFQGTRETTRLKVDSLMRRKGLIVVFRDLDNITYTQRYINANSVDDTEWQKDENWGDCFTDFEDEEFIEVLKSYFTAYIDEKIGNINSDVIINYLDIINGEPISQELYNNIQNAIDNNYTIILDNKTSKRIVISAYNNSNKGLTLYFLDNDLKLDKLFIDKNTRKSSDTSIWFLTNRDGTRYLNDKGIYSTITVPIATSTTIGGIKISPSEPTGDSAGSHGQYKLWLNEESKGYVDIPYATSERLGIIKLGEGLQVDRAGVVSVTNQGISEIPIATNSVIGGVKSTTTGTTAGRDYYIEVEADGKMKVNVPWIAGESGETYKAATDTTLGLIKIGYSQTDKNYPVQLDSNNKAYVNVPWTDTNTTYNKATTTSDGLMSKEDKAKLDSYNGVLILTQDEYNMLETKDNNTVYFIKG